MNLETLLRRELSGITSGDILPNPIAKGRWVDFRVANDFGVSATSMFTAPKDQPKAKKNDVATFVLHLAPASLSGYNACPWSTAGCRSACLNTAGRGVMSNVQRGRVSKTVFAATDPLAFISLVWNEIGSGILKHGEIGVRLNGTSDVRWERAVPSLFSYFHGPVTFYDYTKAPATRALKVPDNYHLTGSATEHDTVADIYRKALSFGRVAVVVDTPAPVGGAPKLPLGCTTWGGVPVVDGDESDWRLEPGPVAVLLRAKGSAKTDRSGFVKPSIMTA